jgi:hypothetical protein
MEAAGEVEGRDEGREAETLLIWELIKSPPAMQADPISLSRPPAQADHTGQRQAGRQAGTYGCPSCS